MTRGALIIFYADLRFWIVDNGDVQEGRILPRSTADRWSAWSYTEKIKELHSVIFFSDRPIPFPGTAREWFSAIPGCRASSPFQNETTTWLSLNRCKAYSSPSMPLVNASILRAACQGMLVAINFEKFQHFHTESFLSASKFFKYFGKG
jgi:hypothetical protein